MYLSVSVRVCVLVCMSICPEHPVVHASGTNNCRLISPVTGHRFSPGKPSRRATTTMGSDEFVVGEDYLLGPSYQQYDWQTGS